MALVELLGNTLVGKDKEVKTSDIKGPVALYFSAHWCPPCRGFTPVLAEWYTNHAKAKGLEIVFISSDKSEDAWKEYFDEMPWLAMPFADRDRKNVVSKKFKVRGIPTMIILNEDGEVISADGREIVSSDPTCENFPWTPKSLPELLGDKFLSKNGEVGFPADKVIGLYFSAHWCPPCKMFTPKLAETYKKVVAAGKNFEVIFISSDRSEEQFEEYFGEMPWLALPFDKRSEKQALSSRFDVNGIPAFVILDEKMNVIAKNGRGVVSSDPEGANFPWPQPPATDLAVSADGIDESPSMVLLVDGLSEADRTAIVDTFNAVAKAHLEKAKEAGDEPIKFFFAVAASSTSGQIRKLCAKDGAKVEVLLLDIEDDGAFYDLAEGPITADRLNEFMRGFTAKTLERKQLQN